MAYSMVKAPLGQGREIRPDSFTDITGADVVNIKYPYEDPQTKSMMLRVIFESPSPLSWQIKQRVARRIMSPSQAEEDLLEAVAGVSMTAPTDTAARLDRLESLIAKIVPLVLGQGVARTEDST